MALVIESAKRPAADVARGDGDLTVAESKAWKAHIKAGQILEYKSLSKF